MPLERVGVCRRSPLPAATYVCCTSISRYTGTQVASSYVGSLNVGSLVACLPGKQAKVIWTEYSDGISISWPS
jgi:hypothetical protein